MKASGRIVFVLVATTLPSMSAVSAAVKTAHADNLRTGWYADQASLTPAFVSSGGFAQRFRTVLNGEIYAQPLVTKGSLIVATENNWVYRLDAENGNVFWSRWLGNPWSPLDLGCGDIPLSMGVTSTPVIDEGTNTLYLVSKVYAAGTSGPGAFHLHALDVITAQERPGFPVALTGVAQNNGALAFDPTRHVQRSALLLLDDVVYIAFSSVCDVGGWQGWVFGVSTAGQIRARWVSRSGTSPSGAGIWMSGDGLISDQAGGILLVTGNGGSPVSSIPGNTPPADLGNAVVRFQVQPDGALKAVDFFTPRNGGRLDLLDEDLGSAGPAALPESYFGTLSIPRLMFTAGKEGYVYLLNRDALGGCRTGAGGADNVVDRKGPYGSVFAHPAVCHTAVR